MPEEVGTEFAEIGSGETEARILPDFLAPDDEKAARFRPRIHPGRFQEEDGTGSIGLEMDNWSAEEVARLLVDLPFEAKDMGVCRREGDEVANVLLEELAAVHLAAGWRRGELCRREAPRTQQATRGDSTSSRWRFTTKLPLSRVCSWSALRDLAGARSGRQGVAGTQGVNRTVSRSLFQELQRRSEQEDTEWIGTGWRSSNWTSSQLLDGHPTSPVTLHGAPRRCRVFFVEVLALAFPSEKDLAKGVKEYLGTRKAARPKRLRLLRSWQDVPGSRDDQTVDETALLDWVHKARSLAKERGLLEFCDSQIGEVFAYAPGEVDGSWPCIPVRDALEEIDTDEVFEGLSAGIYRKRRMHGKTLKEGGSQERELAEKYRHSRTPARSIGRGRPRHSVRREGIRGGARREDERASLRRMILHRIFSGEIGRSPIIDDRAESTGAEAGRAIVKTIRRIGGWLAPYCAPRPSSSRRRWSTCSAAAPHSSSPNASRRSSTPTESS